MINNDKVYTYIHMGCIACLRKCKNMHADIRYFPRILCNQMLVPFFIFSTKKILSHANSQNRYNARNFLRFVMSKSTERVFFVEKNMKCNCLSKKGRRNEMMNNFLIKHHQLSLKFKSKLI